MLALVGAIIDRPRGRVYRFAETAGESATGRATNGRPYQRSTVQISVYRVVSILAVGRGHDPADPVGFCWAAQYFELFHRGITNRFLIVTLTAGSRPRPTEFNLTAR